MRLTIHIDELPDERGPASAWSRIGVSVVIAIVLLAAANAWLARELELYPRNVGYVVVAHKWEAVAAMEEAPSWLFVGDSSCNQGIIADDVAEAFGATAYNACTIGSATVADDAWMLDDLVQRGVVPEHVVVAHSWYTWIREPSTLRAMLFLVAPHSDAWRTGEPRLPLTLGDRLLARIGDDLPLASQAISTRAIVFDPARTSLPPRLAPGDDGFMPMPVRSDRRLEGDIAEHRTYLRDGFEVSAWSRSAMDQLLATAAAHDIEVHFVVAPMPAELRDDPNADAYFAAHRAWLEELAGRNDRVHASLTEPPILPFDVFEKSDHVTDAGASDYTAAIIEALRADGVR